jgi:prepilin-type N-terminal cleavage/methylation domain-containing protein
VKNDLQIMMAGQTCRSAGRRRSAALPARAAFTLIEVMVVVTLLALIIFALMTVFNSTQTAFRASVTQTDVLEGGRATMDLIANDLKPMTPAYQAYPANSPNFYAVVQNGFTQTLPASSALRTNVMEDVFFVARQNQTWKGVGYFVRTNAVYTYDFAAGETGLGNVATLYRFETNASVAQFSANPGVLYTAFDQARHGTNTPTVSKILDGVMSFKVRAFNPAGYWLTNSGVNIIATNYAGYDNWDEVELYDFYSNALPASVEIELGILEDRALKRVESLPTAGLQDGYLSNRVGQVHIFRQRVLIPNADQ